MAMLDILADPNVPMDYDSMYLGAIVRNNKWRFFYSHNISWAIDMRLFYIGNIPENRKRHLYYNRSEFEGFLNTLDLELTTQHIHCRVGKLPLEILIDYDNSRIFEATFDEGFDLVEYIPSEWEVISRHPFIFIPYEILSLWMTRHYLWETDQIGINDYTSIAAIRTEGRWHFFFGIETSWVLDYESFSEKSGVNEYLKQLNYKYYRKRLSVVNEKNVDLYLNLLSNNYIPHNEISRLVYLPSADWHSDKGFTGLRKPKLKYVIDFDERLYVKYVPKIEQINLQVDPTAAFLPAHWMCHHNKTTSYLPEHLQQFWNEV